MTRKWTSATSVKGDEFRLYEDGTWEACSAPSIDRATSQPPDFRQASWGMNLDEVLKKEGAEPLDRTDDHLVYEGAVGHFPCWVNYQFCSDKLTNTWYSFRQEHSQTSNFISDYDSLRAMLDKKYGPGKNSGPIWTNRLYADEPQSEWGTAIATGQLFYMCEWSPPRTKIALYLGGENYEIYFSLRYESVELEELRKAVDEEKVLKDL